MAVVPTNAQIVRAILDIIKPQNLRAGEIFNLLNVNMQLQQRGMRSDEIAKALQSMVDDGLLETAQNSKFLKLTEAGFAAL